MRKGWKEKKLGDILTLEYGKPLPKNKRTAEGLYPVYGANGVKDRTNEFYVEETSIIVGRKGSAGEINYTENKFWPLDVTYFTKFDKNELNLDFLFHLLTLLELPKLAKGVKPGINRNDVYAITTKIPPLPEQKRIVTKLDKCFEAIDKARANVQRNLQNAKELFQSQLNQIFSQKGDGWVEKKLGKSSIIMYGFTTKASRQVSEVKILRITDIQSGSVNWSNVPYCNIGKDDYAKYELKVGDIVFARTGATTGKSYLISKPPKAVFASYLIRVQVNPDEIDPQFLYQFFQTSIYWDLINKGISGSAQGGFNATKLKALIIHYPKSTQEQTQIIETLKGWEESTKLLQSNYQQELDALDELKKSILEKAFNGEL